MFEFGDYVKIDLERAAAYKPLGLNETNNIGRIIGHDIESHEFCVEFLEDVHEHDGNGDGTIDIPGNKNSASLEFYDFVTPYNSPIYLPDLLKNQE